MYFITHLSPQQNLLQQMWGHYSTFETPIVQSGSIIE